MFCFLIYRVIDVTVSPVKLILDIEFHEFWNLMLNNRTDGICEIKQVGKTEQFCIHHVSFIHIGISDTILGDLGK